LDGDAVLLRRGFDGAQALGHHFLADAVAGDDRDAILFLAAHQELPCDLPGRPRRLCWKLCNEPIFAAAQRCSAMLTSAAFPLSISAVPFFQPRKQKPWICTCAANAS